MRGTTDKRGNGAFRLRLAPMPSATLGEFDYNAGSWAFIERPKALDTAVRKSPHRLQDHDARRQSAPEQRPSGNERARQATWIFSMAAGFSTFWQTTATRQSSLL